MPKKSAPKKSVKKSRRTESTPAADSTHILLKPWLADEQAEFHRAHPNANLLIGIFLLSFMVFVAVFVARM